MCRDDWCVQTVLDAVLGCLTAIAGGASADESMCALMREAFGATLTAVVSLDTGTGIATVTLIPIGPEEARLDDAIERLPGAFPQLFDHLVRASRASCLSRDTAVTVRARLASMLGDRPTRGYDVVQLPLGSDESTVRLLALSRETDFDERELHVLDCLTTPLATVCSFARRGSRIRPARATIRARAERLTQRELAVLALEAEGMLARTIADRLEVSVRTVHKHLGNVYRKLDAHDRLVAVRKAEALGLLTAVRTVDGRDTTVEPLVLRW